MKTLKCRESLHQTFCFRGLQARYVFSEDEQERYNKLVKGEEGEAIADELLHLFFQHDDGIYLCDLRLNINYQQVQIDSLLVLDNCVIVFEVKNLSFDLNYRDGNFYLMNGEPFSALNEQLARLKKVVSSYIAQYDPFVDVIVYPFFVNPEQTIHGILLNGDVLVKDNYQHVLMEYRKQFNLGPAAAITKYLLKRSVPNNFDKRMEVDYSLVKKGVYCSVCFKEMQRISQRRVFCVNCNQHSNTSDIVHNAVKDIGKIWPDQLITSKLIADWLGNGVSIRSVQRIMKNNYERIESHHFGHHYR
ncbi:nuclease-related domain-containing protein [Macrococcus lamae]|uniref:NERD domain-containing protein n=1 Tax=Macrococcus lamae TaxID=198484 RepID=A0A4R6BSX3_9STAP|nr:nuclease-related domain-containing protein [Macrococcus lamae]TDM07454.1 NERD domain-containing protein [Macrococcus lamae]